MKKRLLCLLLALVLLSSAASAAAGMGNFKKVNTYTAGQFTDVKGEWFAASVQTAYELGLVKGKTATTFQPAGNITVAETITLAARLHSTYCGNGETFVQGTPWYQVYVDYAKKNGIISQEYDYNTPATRAQFAQILAKALPAEALPEKNFVADNALPDVKITDTFGPAVYMLYRAGILTGSDANGTFKPQSNIQRSEVATIVTRMADAAQRKEVQFGELWQEPVYNTPNTLENRQQAIVETAFAYYYKGTLNQYDMFYLTENAYQYAGGNFRGYTDDKAAPEYCTEDLTQYQWCSSFVYDVMYNTFGYKLLDDHANCRTHNLSSGQVGSDGNKQIVVFQYSTTGNSADDKAAAEKLMKLLQPGDIVTWTRSAADGSGGHSLLYVGDTDGNGRGEVLHRGGNPYDMSTGTDKIETYGIKHEDAQNLLMTPGAFNYLGDKIRISLYRITNLDPQKYPLTASAEARLHNPGLRIDRTVSVGTWASACVGDTLTYELEITNRGHKTLNIPVYEKIPVNCELVSVDGKSKTGPMVSWNLSLTPGQKKTVSYKVKITGFGDGTVTSNGGSVAGIPSNELVVYLQHYKPGDASFQSSANQNAALRTSSDSFSFAAALYEKATGRKLTLTNTTAFLKSDFDTTRFVNVFQPKTVAASETGKMILPGYWGGRRLMSDENMRVLETRLEELQAGDIILIKKNLMDDTGDEAWIYDGSRLMTVRSGKIVKFSQVELTKLLSYQFFVLLRPSTVLQ